MIWEIVAFCTCMAVMIWNFLLRRQLREKKKQNEDLYEDLVRALKVAATLEQGMQRLRGIEVCSCCSGMETVVTKNGVMPCPICHPEQIGS